MNTDDFEQKLQRQTPRQIPAEWRAEILGAALKPERTSTVESSVPFWRLIFARFPVATGAFAAVWLALISINMLLAGTSNSAATRQQFVSTTEPASIWHLQSMELQQLASGEPPISREAPAALPAVIPHGPRSERRREDGVGEIIREHSSNWVA